MYPRHNEHNHKCVASLNKQDTTLQQPYLLKQGKVTKPVSKSLQNSQTPVNVDSNTNICNLKQVVAMQHYKNINICKKFKRVSHLSDRKPSKTSASANI